MTALLAVGLIVTVAWLIVLTTSALRLRREMDRIEALADDAIETLLSARGRQP